VKVEVFSDLVCPWCAVGKRRLAAALETFEHGDEVEVIWRSYELDPGAPSEREGDYVERLARKYAMTRAQAERANDQMTAMAAAEGLDFHFEKVRPGNTFDAHRLMHYAGSISPQKADALKEHLFLAYFTEGAPIGHRDTLRAAASSVGLDDDDVVEVLDGDRFSDQVRTDEREAQELGVSGVPFFVIDGRFAVPGAQDVETLRRALERAWTRSHPLEVLSDPPEARRSACDGQGCTL
jgi:predicted DsbA family dithiol-disulfide isomerase